MSNGVSQVLQGVQILVNQFSVGVAGQIDTNFSGDCLSCIDCEAGKQKAKVTQSHNFNERPNGNIVVAHVVVEMGDFRITTGVCLGQIGLNHTLQCKFVLLEFLLALLVNIGGSVLIASNSPVKEVLDVFRSSLVQDALKRNIFDSSFNEHHFLIKESFQLRVKLDCGIYLCVCSKGNSIPGMLKEPIALIAVEIAGIHKLPLLRAAFNGNTAITQMSHQAIYTLVTHICPPLDFCNYYIVFCGKNKVKCAVKFIVFQYCPVISL